MSLNEQENRLNVATVRGLRNSGGSKRPCRSSSTCDFASCKPERVPRRCHSTLRPLAFCWCRARTLDHGSPFSTCFYGDLILFNYTNCMENTCPACILPWVPTQTPALTRKGDNFRWIRLFVARVRQQTSCRTRTMIFCMYPADPCTANRPGRSIQICSGRVRADTNCRYAGIERTVGSPCSVCIRGRGCLLGLLCPGSTSACRLKAFMLKSYMSYKNGRTEEFLPHSQRVCLKYGKPRNY